MARKDDYETGVPETIVGATVKVEGDLASDGDIKIDGEVTGKIKTTKNLYVGPTAKIQADIEAQNAVFAGLVKGDIKIKDSLILQETGKVDGNISCGRLAIAEGAHFSGSCAMPEAQGSVAEPLPEEE